MNPRHVLGRSQRAKRGNPRSRQAQGTPVHRVSSSPQSAEALCLVRHQVLRQAFTDVELNLTGDHVLVSEELQFPYPTPLHHLENNLLWKLAESESKHSLGFLRNVCSFLSACFQAGEREARHSGCGVAECLTTHCMSTKQDLARALLLSARNPHSQAQP